MSRSDSWRAPYWRQEWARYAWRFKNGEIRELAHGPWRCEECGGPGALELHHLASVRRGGPMYPGPDGLRVLCRRCHVKAERRGRERRRSDRPAWAALVDELQN